MESARVELRKLQLLNDRINQCLDALNQVRLSVHGLSHTTGPFQGNPSAPQIGGIGQGMDPRFGFSGSSFPGQATGFPGGLSHTPFGQNPQFGGYGQNPQFGGYGQNPQFGGFGAGLGPTAGQIPGWNPMSGLSHTGIEQEAGYARPLWADPVLAARVRETFPFVQYPLPPVVSVY